jgi:hypothetical protein
VIPLIFISYLSFLFWSYNYEQHRPDGSAKHKAKLINLATVDGLILGGSNSLFGLSATMMSDILDEQWYNLSLMSEGYSDEKYWRFIKASAPEEIREKVKSIVYSSASGSYLGGNRIKIRAAYSLSQLKDYLIPRKPIAGYLKTYFFGDENLSLTALSNLGDKEFSPTECSREKLNIMVNSRNIDETELNTWVLSQLKVITGLFPNSVIFFVIPSETYSNNDEERSEKNRAIIRESILTFIADKDPIVTLVTQPSYPSIEMLCYDGLHASTSGRIWRTNNLLNSFLSIK